MSQTNETAFRSTEAPNETQAAINAANARANRAETRLKRAERASLWLVIGFFIAVLALVVKSERLQSRYDNLTLINNELRQRVNENDPARGGPPIVSIWDDRLTPPTILVRERDLAEAALMAEMEQRYGTRETPVFEEMFRRGRSESFLLHPTSPGQRPRRLDLAFDRNGCVSRRSIEYNRRLGIGVRSWSATGELCPGSVEPPSPTTADAGTTNTRDAGGQVAP